MPRLVAGSWIWWGGEEEGTGVWGAPSEVQLGGGARGRACGTPSVTWPAAMFAEHRPCGGPSRAPLLPTAPSEGGAVIVAIFQMGKRALKS